MDFFKIKHHIRDYIINDIIEAQDTLYKEEYKSKENHIFSLFISLFPLMSLSNSLSLLVSNTSSLLSSIKSSSC